LLQNPLEDEVLKEIVTEAVDIEREFICESLPCNLIGMNAELMKQYIEFVADRLVVALGVSKIYNTPNPFSWMEQISLQCVFEAVSAWHGHAWIEYCTQVKFAKFRLVVLEATSLSVVL
jgi:hypothetical protein